MAFSIAGLGSYLPPRIVTNDELAAELGISARRIQELFDVEERHWVVDAATGRRMEGQSTADLAAHAARAALDDAGIVAAEVDAVITVSTTPEYVSPPLDYRVRRLLGTGDVLGFSLHSACTGIFRAATIAEALIESERARVVVIAAADAVSQFFVLAAELPKDLRMSMALYGDGAGALVVVGEDTALPKAEAITVVSTASQEEPGIMLVVPYGINTDSLPLENGGMRKLAYHDFHRVLEKGGALTRDAADAVLGRIGKTFADVDHLITHQATGNMRGIARSLGMPADKLRVNIERVGNILSPSILLLMDELERARAFHAGDLLLVGSAESATWSYGGMAVSWR